MVVNTQKFAFWGSCLLFLATCSPIFAQPLFKGSLPNSQLVSVGRYKANQLYCFPSTERTIFGKGSTINGEILFTELVLKNLLKKIKLKELRSECSSALTSNCKKLRKQRKDLRAAKKRCSELEQPTPTLPDDGDGYSPTPTATPQNSPTPNEPESPTPTATPTPTSTPSSLALCSDGIDNDSDGQSDILDPECREFPYSETVAVNGALDSNGWTIFHAQPTTRKIYVSSVIGSDSNDGLSESTPKRTIAAGKLLMRHGYPDWLLLRRGDVFNESLGSWRTGGASPTAPTLVASYGTAIERPILRTSGQSGITVSAGGGAPADLGNIAVIGIDFTAQPRAATTENPTGIVLQKDALHHILIEDSRVTEFKTGLVAQITGGEITDLTIRRNQFFDQYAGDGSHSQGIYTDEVHRLLIEDNLIDNNGGYGSGDPAANAPDIFKHNMYIQGDGREVTIRGNISTRASSHGLQLRPGGIIEGNFFIANPTNCLIAGAAGEFSQVSMNLFAEPAEYIIPSLQRGKNLDIENLDGVDVFNNIIQSSSPIDSSSGITLLRGNELAPLHNVTIRQNVFYGGGKQISISDFGTTPISNINVLDNDLQQVVVYQDDPIVRVLGNSSLAALTTGQNRYFSYLASPQWISTTSGALSLSAFMSQVGDTTSLAQQVIYPEPRLSNDYFEHILGAGADLSDFLAQARMQHKLNYNPEFSAAAVNSWIRSGFNLP